MPKPRVLIDCGPFRGLDVWSGAPYVDRTNAVDLLNVVLDRKSGSYIVARGRVALNIPGGIGATLGLRKFLRQGLPTVFIQVANDAETNPTAALLYYFSDSGGPVSALTFPEGVFWTPRKPASSVVYQKWMFWTNGSDTPVKVGYDLSVTRWQADPPTSAPTATAGGSGNLNSLGNPYIYRVTFGNDDIETSPGPVSNPVSVANQSVTLTNIPTSPDPQITQRNIYRIGGTWSTFKLVGTIPDNTTTTFTDNVPDSNLGQTLTIFRDPPRPFWYIEVHKERIFGFGTNDAPSDLFYSNYREPWGWNYADQVIPVGRNFSGDVARGLASIGSILVLFKRDTTWALYGDSKQDFLVRKLFDIGCIAPRSITKAVGAVFWLSKQGAFMFDGSTPRRISLKIKPILDDLSEDALSRAVGFFRDQVWYLSFPTEGVTFGYDLVLEEWFKLGWAGEVADYDPATSDVVASRAASGQVDRWFADYDGQDLGWPINAAWYSKVEDSGAPEAIKRYRWVTFTAPLQPRNTWWTATVTVIADPGEGGIAESKTIDLTAPPPHKLISLPPTLKGSYGQLIISSYGFAEIHKVQVHGWIDKVYVPR